MDDRDQNATDSNAETDDDAGAGEGRGRDAPDRSSDARVGEESDALLDDPGDAADREGELEPPAVTDRDVLAAFANAGDPLLARDVAETLPIEVEDAQDRLDDLAERGLLVVDEGAPGDAMRLAPDAPAEALPDEDVETDVEAQATKITGTETRPHDSETTTTPPADPQEGPAGRIYDPPSDAVEAFDPPGTPEQAEQRREALRVAYSYLRERGRADRDDFVSAVFPEAPGAYEDPDDGWWERVIRPGLKTLPGVEIDDAGPGEAEFRFAGERGGGRD